ncbi:pyridoxal phosphate-dependent aminotransferase [Dickeya solani]|uniref:Pyridoxal phosphate-dependent aminotransferase n=1 Tax=Dickeya solani TaxID=1089444 RepID=A0AAX4EYA9_9GAMM|nr:pyridoxal phosphate-dependent aminotransferase [Dickeya solani]MCA6999558.1 pyridoxal phosphate-dependent aminotransferase [Dickeya solani]MCZ0819758.1 pyridoxal phosphate-dependent aminotransferase [Dickeya solani]MDV6993770.1 pyridoxal phosphate-dependent aminotransferase [Dickeya solani]MDV7005126.1 pyridoxal phosphate-dependent aminotransferase [Dickeya solani]MDV7038943.1 pyridoxal phosphate-dependent aminotransferase [Dickeya solani]
MPIQTPVQFSSKLPDVGTTIFTVIGQLSSQHNAINLSQGAPSFPCSPNLIAGVTRAMTEGHNQYASMSGLVSLKEVVAEKVKRLYGQHYDAGSEVTITASASEGLYSAISALVHPGDEVIYFEPSFDSYAPIVRLQGATPVALKLAVPSFAINWDEVQAAITPRTRMIIINSPHNPSGQVLSADDLAQLARLTRNTDIVILSDEVYEHVVFDGQRHHSMATHSELAARSVIVSSFGKTFHVTGWRVGYCLAPAALMDEILKIHQFMMFSADTPMQYAFAEYMADPATYLSLGQFYQHKRDLLINALQDGPFELLPSAGSFFMLASFAHFSDESDSDMVKRLIVDHGVATIPLSAFYTDGTDNKLIRLSFSKDDETLLAGAKALCQAAERRR